MRIVVPVLAIGFVAIVVALIVNRRSRGPVEVTIGQPPTRVDRLDFPHPEASVLVALFSSRTCDACVAIGRFLADLAGPGVATVEVSWQERRDLHERYGIPAVPTTLVAGEDGTVTFSVVGPVTREDLDRAVRGVS